MRLSIPPCDNLPNYNCCVLPQRFQAACSEGLGRLSCTVVEAATRRCYHSCNRPVIFHFGILVRFLEFFGNCSQIRSVVGLLPVRPHYVPHSLLRYHAVAVYTEAQKHCAP